MLIGTLYMNVTSSENMNILEERNLKIYQENTLSFPTVYVI